MQEGDINIIPASIHNFIVNTFTFRVKITEDNINLGYEDYTVTTVIEDHNNIEENKYPQDDMNDITRREATSKQKKRLDDTDTNNNNATTTKKTEHTTTSAQKLKSIIIIKEEPAE